ncbi:hypothetical protein [Streptomyces sp. NPDC007991]|uniref:hypothetical protein n=1 Tax=Streptomyces sp. NPDC007991 TaxID=3364803 RepID=UPI0036F186FB
MSQQQPHARPHRRPLPRAHRLRAAAPAAALLMLPLVTACGGGDDAEPGAGGRTTTPSGSAAPAAGVVAPAKVEVIAGLTGCKVKIRTEADELREGVCHTAKGDYLITTFPQEKLKKTWLEAARVYGGTYLVGMRWVVSAKPQMLEPLRAKLGGTVTTLRGTGPGPSTS